MGGVRTPIIERPRPSPGDRRAEQYTLNPEEPVMSAECQNGSAVNWLIRIDGVVLA
jgi:hypothetical protein